MPHNSNFDPTSFPDYVSDKNGGAVPLATAAVQHEMDPQPQIAPTNEGQGENGSNPSATNFDVHPEGVPERNVYGTPLGVAAKTTREDGVPLLGSQSRPEPKSEQSFWKRFRTPLIAGTTALVAVGTTIIVLNPFAKKETTDTENAGATPPAATAGSLGVDAPKTSSINTGANTATVQAQPTAEAPVTTEHRDGQGAGDPQGTQEALPSNLTGTIDPNKADSAFSPESSRTIDVSINGERVQLYTLPVLSPNANVAEADNYSNRVISLYSAALSIYLTNPNSPDFKTVMDALTDSPVVYDAVVQDAQDLSANQPKSGKSIMVIRDAPEGPAHFQIGAPANNGTDKMLWNNPQDGSTYFSMTDGMPLIMDQVDASTNKWGEVNPNAEPLSRSLLNGMIATQYNNVANGNSTLKSLSFTRFDG